MPLTDSFKALLLRGVCAGLLAGLLAGGVAFVLGEPQISAAIALEDSDAHRDSSGHDPAVAHAHDEESSTPPVSRDGQRAGLILATTLTGIALGSVFAVGAHYTRKFTALPGPLLSVVLAALGWLAVSAVPFFKYPPNPPAVGDPETFGERTVLWLAALTLGIVAVSVAVSVAKITAAQGLWTVRLVAGVAAFLVVVTIGYLLLPAIDEVGQFPATLLWQFRISSAATQACLWLTLGLAFAVFTDRAGRTASAPTVRGGAQSASRDKHERTDTTARVT